MLHNYFQILVFVGLLTGQVCATCEECRGIPVFPGQGTIVELDKADISKKGDATWVSNEETLVLAHGPDKDGALAFGTTLQKLGVDRFSFGMQFGFRIRNDPNEGGYGFIMSYGGDQECVHDRVMRRDGRLFGPESRTFCEGVYFAAWMDGNDPGIYLLVDGHVVAFIEDTPEKQLFNKYHCITMQVHQPTTHEPGHVEYLLDGRVLGHPLKFREQDLEGAGKAVFAYGSTAKHSFGTEVEMQAIEFKTTRDMSSVNLFEGLDSVIRSGVQTMVW
eukprot:CAMPEP_0113937492 /NCGR_PEP_ID=MMETSP1339-20121228/4107_1 /TAXON_ID=94617 /ORGANISM="Fibrocapsa japonica" /LENGTH=274 /DNA_ID=CAMNT_0000940285 /DNA_START=50 /DNA_END=871 /DNA_ORIENTATION=+ /assembly_acc=CAM_ASM_000762